MTWDDDLYYRTARSLWAGQAPPSDFSPGFALLVAPFANPWLTETAALFWVRLMLTLSATALTVLAVHRVANRPMALAAAAIVAASPVPAVYTIIRPATAAIFASALVLTEASPRRTGLALGALAFGVLVRPELLVVVVVASVLLFPFLHTRLRWYLPAVAGIALVVGYTMLVPAFSDNRMLWAFGQHYGLTARELSLWDGDNWHDYKELLDRDFGRIRSVSEAARNNPAAVLTHVRHNIAILPAEAAVALGAGHRLRHRLLPIGLGAFIVALGLWGFLSNPAHAVVVLSATRPQLMIIASTLTVLPVLLIIRPSADMLFTLLPSMAVLAGIAASIALPRVWRGRCG